jgi:outer membrane protein assembly factor BamB
MFLRSSFFLAALSVTMLAASTRADEQFAPGDTVVVIGDQARLGASGKWLANLEKGTNAKVLVVKGDWVGVSVTINGELLQGWVKRNDLEATPSTLHTPAKGFWPQFHGPRRDNISDETGLLEVWPDDGPTLIWTADGIGFGYATVSVAHGLIYTAGNIDDKTVISALDGDGEAVWQVPCGPAWDKEFPGTRATPTIDANRLYFQSPLGEVVCLDARTGTRHWGLNILETFGGQNIRWALCESLLIDGPHVICCPGGDQTAVVALDKMTGETVWKSPSAGELAGYASPSLGEWRGVRMIFTTTAKGIIAVNADNGDLLWKVKHETPFDENIQMPLYHNGQVFLSTQRTGSVMLRLLVQDDPAAVEEAWRSKNLDNHHGGVLLLDGLLYSAGSANNPKLRCISWQTGELVFEEPSVRKGSLTYVDGMLYCVGERGTVSLVRADPNDHAVVSQFKLPQGPKGNSWAHPVVCGSRLYIRHGDRLYAYDIKR